MSTDANNKENAVAAVQPVSDAKPLETSVPSEFSFGVQEKKAVEEALKTGSLINSQTDRKKVKVSNPVRDFKNFFGTRARREFKEDAFTYARDTYCKFHETFSFQKQVGDKHFPHHYPYLKDLEKEPAAFQPLFEKEINRQVQEWFRTWCFELGSKGVMTKDIGNPRYDSYPLVGDRKEKFLNFKSFWDKYACQKTREEALKSHAFGVGAEHRQKHLNQSRSESGSRGRTPPPQTKVVGISPSNPEVKRLIEAGIKKALEEERKKNQKPQKEKLEEERTPPVRTAATAAVVKYEFISEWANTLCVPVAAKDSYVQAYADQRGIKYRVNDETTLNPHSCSALEREAAMKVFLAIVGKNKKEMKILSHFGANRDKRLKPKANQDIKIEWTLAPNTPIQGDASRDFSERTFLNGDILFDAAVIVDVYQSGAGPEECLNSETVKKLCSATTSGQCYGILRTFYGHAGADVFVVEKDGKKQTKIEGVWIKENGLVHFSSDRTCSTYAGHPSPDWIMQRHYDGLDISEVKDFGPYKLYRFAISQEGAQPLAKTLLPEAVVQDVVINSADVLDESVLSKLKYAFNTFKQNLPTFVTKLFPEMRTYKVLMHARSYASVSSHFQYKNVGGLTLDAVNSKVDSLLDADIVMMSVKERYPEFFRRVRNGTVHAVMYYKKAENIDFAMDLRTTNLGSEARVKDLRNINSPSLSPIPKILVMLSAIFGIGYCLYRIKQKKPLAPASVGLTLKKFSVDLRERKDQLFAYFKGGFLEDVWWTVNLHRRPMFFLGTFIGPLVEEVLKSFFPQFASGLIAMETAIKLFGSYVSGQSFYPAFHSTMAHIITYYLGVYFGLPVAVLFHYINNFLAIVAYRKELENAMNGVCALPQKTVEQAVQKVVVGTGVASTMWVFKELKDKIAELEEDRKFGLWKWFKEQYEIQYKEIMLPIHGGMVPEGSRLNPVECKTYPNEPLRGHIEVSFITSMSVQDVRQHVLFWDDSATKTEHAIYPLLINNGLMYAPANSQNNLLACLMHRIHNDPFKNCPPENLRHQNWKNLFKTYLVKETIRYFCAFNLSNPCDFPTMDEVVKIMGPKGRRIERCSERLEDGEDMSFSKSYNVKFNETLPLKDFGGGAIDIKPRAICNFDPVVHVWTTQIARYITNVLHEVFNETRTFETPYGPLKVIFASGYTQIELTRMWKVMDSNPNFVCVAGDDSMFKITLPDGKVVYGEVDFTMFDQSQDGGPNEIMFRRFMYAIGMEREMIDLFVKCFSADYAVWPRKNRPLKIKGSGGIQLPTGVTVTTVWNSMNNIFSYFSAFQIKPFDYKKCALNLGFTPKIHEQSFPDGLTFLKGWWVRNFREEMVWMPLPSAVLKLGKFLKPPQYFKPRAKATLQECYQVLANMTRRSYASVPFNYPILGAFMYVMELNSNPSSSGDYDVVNENPYKPDLDAKLETIDRDYLIDLMMDRYDITREEIEQVEQLYRNVESLPWIVSHPVFYSLQQRDYA